MTRIIPEAVCYIGSNFANLVQKPTMKRQYPTLDDFKSATRRGEVVTPYIVVGTDISLEDSLITVEEYLSNCSFDFEGRNTGNKLTLPAVIKLVEEDYTSISNSGILVVMGERKTQREKIASIQARATNYMRSFQR